jgi:hypothetical protein
MIISVSGKIGSGKDTVANLIMQLTPTKNWKIKKFAGKLKQVATLITAIPIEKWEDQEFKQSQLGPEWNMTVRDFLQKLGTEAVRDGLHSNAWVNALFADYKIQTVYEGEWDYWEKQVEPNWIITDTRFPNEIEAIQNRNGILIKVIRDSGNTVGTGHSSETALDNFTQWNYVIENNGTIEDLKQKVAEILLKENITI